MNNHSLIAVTIFLISLTVGCATSLSRSFSDNISGAILNQNDPAIVRDGAPAFLLLLDGLIADNPGDRELLRAAADLYSAYALVFVTEPERAQRLSARARDYGRQALCLKKNPICDNFNLPSPELAELLTSVDSNELPYLYSFSAAWLGWVQANSDDWNARADLPKIDALMHRVVELEETYQWGRGHLYLGVMNSLLPPALGGNLKHGREHFEQALTISNQRDLAVKVNYARYYARLAFDQKLHDELLQQVLDADPEYPDLTLSNVIAQQQAQALLSGSSDFFGE